MLDKWRKLQRRLHRFVMLVKAQVLLHQQRMLDDPRAHAKKPASAGFVVITYLHSTVAVPYLAAFQFVSRPWTTGCHHYSTDFELRCLSEVCTARVGRKTP
jgi:hypothetical protein